jgi:hypothetical protein
MTNTKNLLDIPIEYKVLAYKSTWYKSNEIIYAGKISDSAVTVTGLSNGCIYTNVFFKPSGYIEQKPTKKNVWSNIWTDEMLEKLEIRKTYSLESNAQIEQILKPISKTGRWYETAVDITSMFKTK